MGHVPEGIALPIGEFVEDSLHRLLPGNVRSGGMADPVEAVVDLLDQQVKRPPSSTFCCDLDPIVRRGQRVVFRIRDPRQAHCRGESSGAPRYVYGLPLAEFRLAW